VDRVRVLPIRFSQDRAVDARALMGDAILKTYMLDHIFENEPPKLAADKSYLSRRLSAALSNDTMAKHASSTMPPDLADFLREMDASAHDIGTTTEAIVYEVRDNVLAVKQLASCLLKWSNSDMDAVRAPPPSSSYITHTPNEALFGFLIKSWLMKLCMSY
jgi:hypothetical protein